MNETTFHENGEGSEPAKRFWTEKRWLLLVCVPVFVFISILAGLVIDERSQYQRVIDVGLTLGLNIAAFVWCRIDSRERNYELHRFFVFAVIILGTLALLYYLFRSRGFVGGLKSTGWLILYAIVCLVAVAMLASSVVLVLTAVGIVPVPDI